MINSVEMAKFGSDGNRISLWLEAEVTGFDYQNDCRDVILRAYAVTDTENAVITSSSSSYVVFATRNYYLPSEFTLQKDVRNILGEWEISDLPNELFPLYSVVRLYCKYSSAQVPIISTVANGVILLGKMYYSPEVSVSSDRIAFGSEMVFSGTILSQGYNITAAIMKNGQLLASKEIDSENNTLMCSYEWLSAYPESREEQFEIVFDADYRGKELPETLTLTGTFYLANGDGLPDGDVEITFPSDNTIISGLGIAVRNKTGVRIEVENASALYGATVEDCTITFDGEAVSGYVYQKNIQTESGTKNYTVKITDSRQSVRVYTGTVKVFDYAQPDFTATVKRTDSSGTESKRGSYVCISAQLVDSYDFDGINSYQFSYACCKSGQSEPSGRTVINPSSPVMLNILDDISSSYDLYLYCEDSVGGSVGKKYVLECDRVEMNISAGKVGIGKLAVTPGLLDCAWPIKSGGDITFTLPDGEEKSLSGIFGDGYSAVKFKGVTVSDPQGLTELLSPQDDGVAIVVADIATAGLSYGQGRHLLIVAKYADTVTVKEL